MGLVSTQPYRCRQKLTLAVQTCSLCGWHSCRHDGMRSKLRKTGRRTAPRGKQRFLDSQQTHVVSQQMAGNMEEELPQRRLDVKNLWEDHRPQRPKRQFQQPCCAVEPAAPTSPAVSARVRGRRRMVGRRLMALTRLAQVVGQTLRWSQHAGRQGGSQSACRSWWARSNQINTPSSHLIAANQSRHPEGRHQGLPREFGRSKIDKWVNWRIRTRQRPATQAKDTWLICALLVARHGARRKSS